MDKAIIIHGEISGREFIPSEPIPEIQGHADLIVYPSALGTDPHRSILDFSGKASCLRSGKDIDRQVREERDSWDNK